MKQGHIVHVYIAKITLFSSQHLSAVVNIKITENETLKHDFLFLLPSHFVLSATGL